jgi:hypothetical protein
MLSGILLKRSIHNLLDEGDFAIAEITISKNCQSKSSYVEIAYGAQSR